MKPLPPEALAVTRPLLESMADCPGCQVNGLAWKTKDANGPFLGQVFCPSCGWTRTKQEFLVIWKESR